MVAKTDLTAQLVALNRVLAEATKKCPDCKGVGRKRAGFTTADPDRTVADAAMEVGCEPCQGTGRVARFPEFRQECIHKKAILVPCPPGCTTTLDPHFHNSSTHQEDCTYCNGTGWQVRAGGLEGGLAGLTKGQAEQFFHLMPQQVIEIPQLHRQDDPMPSRPEILRKGLELVCEIAGLEVPLHHQTTNIDWTRSEDSLSDDVQWTEKADV